MFRKLFKKDRVQPEPLVSNIELDEEAKKKARSIVERDLMILLAHQRGEELTKEDFMGLAE